MSSLADVIRGGPSDDWLRRHEERVRLNEPPELPHGRYGLIQAEDLAATKHRVLTGLPMLPMPGWRW